MNRTAFEMVFAVAFTAGALAELVIFKNSGYWLSAVGAILGATLAIVVILNTLRRVIHENESKH